MTRHDADIFISGGGIAGQIAALVMAARGFCVVMADPVRPVVTAGEEASDLRSTAFLRPAKALFESAGLWEALAAHARALDALEVIDTKGWPPEIRARRRFESGDLGEGPFGWNLMNWRIRRELARLLKESPRVSALYGSGFRSLVNRSGEVIVRLSDGAQVRARLALAADGRASPLREAAGIGVHTTRYGQKSLAFTVTHDVPHGNVSTEIYNQGGPFTVVPLPDLGGAPASAIVWMNKGPRAVELLNLPVDAFEAEMRLRACGLWGAMKLEGHRSIWPIVTQRAEALTAGRVAVMAEAAHALPPIGAQGLNTSLNDLAVLADLAAASPGALGDGTMMRAYEKARAPDIAKRARVIDLFNRVAGSGEAALQALRLAGLRAVHDIPPLRHGVMQAGLGPGK